MQTIPDSVTHGLISYIGNKRRILPELAVELSALLRPGGGTTLLDPFCGSGAVSRLARHLGYAVSANDWEPYARAVTAPYLENAPADLPDLFAPFGGLARLYDRLNACRTPLQPYISRHYAPRETALPRLGAERLFYTAENARFIDAVREEIDRILPETDAGSARARAVVLASLLHQASVHANTSGVFKAYHRGFGGLGRDALGRILRPMQLQPPQLTDGPRGEARCTDATRFLSTASGDVCYVDPPYAGHQYGSNYFMLNTILLWDKPDVDSSRDSDGMLLSKAGIRPDWVATRSAFCSRRDAAKAMRTLLDSIDARYLVLSYSTDGIIPLEELAEMLHEHGALTARRIEYVTYRGGRQSASRRVSNGEFVFVVDRTGGRGTAGVPESVAGHIAWAEAKDVISRRFVPERLHARFSVRDGRVALAPGWEGVTVDGYLLDVPNPPPDLAASTIVPVAHELANAACEDYLEELGVVVGLLWERPDQTAYRDRVGDLLHKVAHRKYRARFEAAVAMVYRAMVVRPGVFGSLAERVAEVGARAKLRYGAGPTDRR